MMKKTSVLLALVLSASVLAAGCYGTADDQDVSIGQISSALTAGACGQSVAPMLLEDGVATNLAGGTATVSNTATDLIVSLQGNLLEGWQFSDIFAYAGTGPVPTDPIGGWPDFGQFPIARSYGLGVTSQQISLPLSTIVTGTAAGQTINVSVYVVMVKTDSAGNIIATAWGWAYGENHTGCGCYGIAFPYTFCGGTTVQTGCTLTQGYWKTHNETAKTRSLRIDWPAPMDERQLLCPTDARTLLTILSTNPRVGNAYLILAHQYIAAKLNVASGASTTAQVDAAMLEAKRLLEASCGQFVQSSTVDGQLMVIFGGVLDAYNNGLTGPGHCNE